MLSKLPRYIHNLTQINLKVCVNVRPQNLLYYGAGSFNKFLTGDDSAAARASFKTALWDCKIQKEKRWDPHYWSLLCGSRKYPCMPPSPPPPYRRNWNFLGMRDGGFCRTKMFKKCMYEVYQ